MTTPTSTSDSGEAIPFSSGAFMRSLREQSGLSQSELAEKAGISRELLVRLEAGLVEPTLADLQPLLEVAGVDIEFRPVSKEAVEAAEGDTSVGALDPVDVDPNGLMVGSYEWACHRLEDLALLEKGWYNGESGLPVADHVIETTQRFLDELRGTGVVFPRLFPNAEQGVSAEWRMQGSGMSLTVEFLHDGGVELCAMNPRVSTEDMLFFTVKSEQVGRVVGFVCAVHVFGVTANVFDYTT